MRTCLRGVLQYAGTVAESGKALFLPDDRVYGDYHEMIEKEKALPADRRMDFVAIVTPNYLHFPPAKLALENGFPVMCDKPMTISLAEAKNCGTSSGKPASSSA
jgi:predicted dehydrogenase